MRACVQILSKDKGGFDVFSHALEDSTWRAARKYIAPFFTAANIRCVLWAAEQPAFNVPLQMSSVLHDCAKFDRLVCNSSCALNNRRLCTRRSA